MAVKKRTKKKVVSNKVVKKIPVTLYVTEKQKSALLKMKKAYEKESETKCYLSSFVTAVALGEIVL